MKRQPKPWQKISSRIILNHPLLQINEDSVLLPDGKITSYVLDAPTITHSVIIIVINPKKQILLQREFSYPTSQVMWQLPGGTMLPNEDIETAAQRELSEESNYMVKDIENIGYFYVNNRRSDRKQHVLVGRQPYVHSSVKDDDEFIESYWISIPNVKKMIKSREINNINLLAALNMWFLKD